MKEINPETGTIYSRSELLDAFRVVENKENWKLPIDAYISSEREAVTREAVIFFAGCVPTFERLLGTDTLRVKAVGYYAAVGA